MIIIGTKEEIEAMINEACPYNGRESCDDDCRACWNRSASIVIADPEIRMVFLYSMTNGNNFIGKEGEEDE